MGMGLEWRWDREPLCWHTGLEVRTGSITPSAPTWEPGRREEPPPPLRWHRGGGTVTPPGCRAALSAATASAAALHEAPLPAPTAAGGGSEAERGHVALPKPAAKRGCCQRLLHGGEGQCLSHPMRVAGLQWWPQSTGQLWGHKQDWLLYSTPSKGCIQTPFLRAGRLYCHIHAVTAGGGDAVGHEGPRKEAVQVYKSFYLLLV